MDQVMAHTGDGIIPNKDAYGIEFERLYDKSKGRYEPLTDFQKKNEATLIARWAIANGYNPEDLESRVFGHSEITTFDPKNRGKYDTSIPEKVKASYKTDKNPEYWGKSRKADFTVPERKEMVRLAQQQMAKETAEGFTYRDRRQSPAIESLATNERIIKKRVLSQPTPPKKLPTKSFKPSPLMYEEGVSVGNATGR